MADDGHKTAADWYAACGGATQAALCV